MISKTSDFIEFGELRPRVRALLELHRCAQTEEARALLVEMFEDAFLAAAWHVAQDMLEHGWSPSVVSRRQGGGPPNLRIVGDSDAA
jgi:hypothetical protein